MVFFSKLVNKRMHRQHGVSFSRQIALVFFCNALLLLQVCLSKRNYGPKQKFCPFTMVAVFE